MHVGLKGLNTQQIMSKIGRANEQNRPNLEELQQIGSFWSTIHVYVSTVLTSDSSNSSTTSSTLDELRAGRLNGKY